MQIAGASFNKSTIRPGMLGKSNNNIGDNGAAGLVGGLKTNSTLQRLYLVSSVGVCVMFTGEHVVGLIRLAC